MKNLYTGLLITVFNFSVMAAEVNKVKVQELKVTSTTLNAQDHNSARSNKGSVKAPVDKNKKKLNTSTTLNAQDHNSTRSNRGTIKKTDAEDINQNSKTTRARKGRNPQTGKEIN